MQELWKLVSSPRHLLVFEAAARTGSFTRAARELNVQQPAVSAAIKQLEGSLGTQLFARAHRSVTLTHAGERLYNEVAASFGRIYSTASMLAQRSAKAHVTLSASTAFAHYWISTCAFRPRSASRISTPKAFPWPSAAARGTGRAARPA